MNSQTPSECTHSAIADSKAGYFKTFFFKMMWGSIEGLRFPCPQCGYVIAPPNRLMWHAGFSYALSLFVLTVIIVFTKSFSIDISSWLYLAVRAIALFGFLAIRPAIFSRLLLKAQWNTPGFEAGLDTSTMRWYKKGLHAGLALSFAFAILLTLLLSRRIYG